LIVFIIMHDLLIAQAQRSGVPAREVLVCLLALNVAEERLRITWPFDDGCHGLTQTAGFKKNGRPGINRTALRVIG